MEKKEQETVEEKEKEVQEQPENKEEDHKTRLLQAKKSRIQ